MGGGSLVTVCQLVLLLNGPCVVESGSSDAVLLLEPPLLKLNTTHKHTHTHTANSCTSAHARHDAHSPNASAARTGNKADGGGREFNAEFFFFLCVESA